MLVRCKVAEIFGCSFFFYSEVRKHVEKGWLSMTEQKAFIGLSSKASLNLPQ